MKSDDEIVEQVISENQEGLERLGDEEPAREMRSFFHRVKGRIQRLVSNEEKIGTVSV